MEGFGGIAGGGGGIRTKLKSLKIFWANQVDTNKCTNNKKN